MSSKKFKREMLSSYKERVNVVEMLSDHDRKGSLYLRIKNIFSLFLMSMKQVHKKRYDFIILTSYPPFLQSMILLFFINKGTKIIYYVQDIQINYFKLKILNKLLRISIKYILKRTNYVITLSSEMKDTLLDINHNFDKKDIFVLNNFTDTIDENKNLSISNIQKKYDLIYAGSLGTQQQVLNFVKFFKKFLYTNQQRKFVIYGEGTERHDIEKYISDEKLQKNILLKKYIPKEELMIEISKSKFVLVSVKNDIFNFAYPSKIIDSIINGFPVLVTADTDSKISNFINQNNLGSSINIYSNDINNEMVLLENLLKNYKKFSSEIIQDFANKEFGKNKFLSKFNEIFEQISEN